MAAGGDPGPEQDRAQALSEFARRAARPTLAAIVDENSAEVMTKLRGAGIPFLVLKGPALAQLLYRPDERRPYMDLDLLIAPGYREQAGAVLAALGYENLTAAAGVDDFTGAVHAETWHSQDRMPVDVHSRLAGCRADPEAAWPLLFVDRQSIVVAGVEAPVPARRGLALHLATHAAQHGPGDAKAIGDLERGIERWSVDDWRAAAELAEALDATEALAAGLRLSESGAALATALELPPTPELSWEIVNRRERPRGTFHLQALRSARGPREVLGVLRRSLLPTRAWIEREYPWAGRSRARLAAAYLRHVLRAPLWAARSWRYRRRASGAPDTRP